MNATNSSALEQISVVDTHTGGEPTRVILDYPFELTGQTMVERCRRLESNLDRYRRAILCEPRGNDVLVGAVLTPPERQESIAGVIFCNNVGYLGMCGHGTIGVAVALHSLGRIQAGVHQIDTPVGPVSFELMAENTVAIRNVVSYRLRRSVPVALGDGREVHGDIAWGGNWFFICSDHGLSVEPSNLSQLQATSQEIRMRIASQGITGAGNAEIDHIELIGAPSSAEAYNARNFVLCPGGEYDRSPCGTGTSAKLACMAADRALAPGELYRQESIVGSVFEASYEWAPDDQHPAEFKAVLPKIQGNAYVTAESKLILDPADPFQMGLFGIRKGRHE